LGNLSLTAACRSRLRFVVQNPAQLFRGIGNDVAPCRLNGCQSVLRIPAEMDQCARRGERRPADASPAVYADALSRAQAIGQSRNKGPERRLVRGHMNVLNGIRKKAHAQLSGKRSFFAQAKPIGFVGLEQRDQYLDPAPCDLTQFFLENAATVRARHNGQRYSRISFNPKHRVHAFRLPQTDWHAGARRDSFDDRRWARGDRPDETEKRPGLRRKRRTRSATLIVCRTMNSKGNEARNPCQNARIEEAFGLGFMTIRREGPHKRCCAFCRLMFF